MQHYQPNAFLAKPTKFRGRGMHGVISYPGFHTTTRYSVACSYANAKVDDLTPSEWTATLKKSWSSPMPDYPVVISLVMRGKPRVEYHGTSYRNLLKAAPRLCARLPKPPPPYEDPGD